MTAPHRVPSALRDLDRLRSAAGTGITASMGVLYADAVFGRDSVEVAGDLLAVRPHLAREVIVRLAALQGVTECPEGSASSEEEPGRIHHEHRSLHVGGRRVSPESERIFRELSRLWGGDASSMTYYGSADATPLYVRLVADYCRVHDTSVLAETVIDRCGRRIAVCDAALAATRWIAQKLRDSAIGLLEFKRRNVPNGHVYQVWKDSGTSYLHRDGSLADFRQPIAAVEVQAYAYDALLGAAEVLPDHTADEPDAWRRAAEQLRDRTLDLFWMPHEAYFAMGIDRDRDGLPRRVEGIASNGALVLDSGLLAGHRDRRRYVAGTVRRILGPDFLTDVGIRCRSLVEDELLDFQDYHGTWAVWPKETSDVARALRRQGLVRLARELEVRILNGVNAAGGHAEFLYVSPDQQVHYDFREGHPAGHDPRVILGTNLPEDVQAWTVSAALAAKTRLGARGRGQQPEGWQTALEDEVLGGITPARLLRTREQCAAAFGRRGDFTVDREEAWKRDRAARLTRVR